MSVPENSPTGSTNATACESSDAAGMRVRIDERIVFSSRDSGNETSYVGKDSRTGKFYRFGLQEYHAVTLFDGSRDLKGVHEQLNRDGVSWTIAEVAGFASELVKHRLAVVIAPRPTAGEPRSAPKHSPTSKGRFSKLLMTLSWMLSQRIPLADGHRVARAMTPWMGWAFEKPAMILWAGLVGSGWFCVYQNAGDYQRELSRLFDSHLWIVLIVVWCCLKTIHEIGHAVCAFRHGVRVGRMGILFFLFAPLAYVDVTDAWKLTSRGQRVQIALAGVYLELAVGAVAALAWWWLPTGFMKHLAAQVFLVAGPTTLLINANPLLRLDGYYVLSDWLEIPNLRMHGRAQLLAWIETHLMRMPRRPALLQGWRRTFATAHAACSIAFQAAWMSSLVIAVSYWAKGIGLILGVVATFVWAVIPLSRWMHKVWTFEPDRDHEQTAVDRSVDPAQDRGAIQNKTSFSLGAWLSPYQRRLIGVSTIVVVMAQYLATASSPLDRRVPVVVRYQNEQIARAPSDAFVDNVYVRCGQRVTAGQLLIVLRDPELLLQRDQLIDQRDLAKLQSVQHQRRGELALADSARERSESLGRQVEQLGEKVNELRIVAHRNGTITSPMTDRLPGRYVRAGDVLAHVSDPREKELLAIVSERDMTAFQRAAEQGSGATVRLRGGRTIIAKLTELRPRVKKNLSHPALSAGVGGPLAVEPANESQEMRLVQPQLESVVALDSLTSAQVHAGQIGRLTIPDDRSFVARLWEYLNENADKRIE